MKLRCFFLLLLALLSPLFSEEVTSHKHLRFFNLDLHVSVIGDLEEILKPLGHEIVNWSISGHCWVFGKEKDHVEIVNDNTWMYLDEKMCERFYERYKDYLSQFDGFIVTHTPAFALLYAKFNKPIIIVNSTRYEQPFTKDPQKWAWLNHYLQEGVRKGRIFIVSNNKGDQRYLLSHTGIESELIPSLCLYTHANYTGQHNGFIVHAIFDKGFKSDVKRGLGKKGWHLFQNKKLPKHYSWRELYDFKGVVHFPYQISTMSIFEQYSANVPLFLPSKKFLLELSKRYPRSVLSQLSFYQVLGLAQPNAPGDMNNLNDPQVLSAWIDSADYYDRDNMPYIQYFDSFRHLKKLLLHADCAQISRQMQEHNVKRKEAVIAKWQALLDKISSSNFLP